MSDNDLSAGRAGTPRTDHPDVAAGEQAALRESGIAVDLPEPLVRLRDHLVGAFGDLTVSTFRGELTVIAAPKQLEDLLRFCRDNEDVRCELLADLTCVHWPAGDRTVRTQETTGWPAYTEQGDGRIDVAYILYSLTHNHRLRIQVPLDDRAPAIPSAAGIYGAANFMEREAFDFFGVTFDGHPNLVRTHMPDDWDGHPLRKDYPLGGVPVEYKGATIPPPEERTY